MFTQNELHLLFDWIDIDKIDDERRQYHMSDPHIDYCDREEYERRQYALVAKILNLMD